MVKRVLMIAFHFPPMQGSSGIQRTLKFAQYLGAHGWEPIVLSASARAYTVTSNDQMGEIPDNIVVTRAFALDSARHLSLAGRYPRWLAMPDRWSSWFLGAVPAGLRLIRRMRPQAIWSTYPIATAHLIALALQRLSGLPWIADFRDSMTEERYPADATVRRIYRRIERGAISRSRYAVFTAPGTLRMYAERYPEIGETRMRVVANAYDEENFEAAQRITFSRRAKDGPTVLVHSGLLYPSERDPTAFYAALAALQRDGHIGPGALRVVLRATGSDEHHRRLIESHGIADMVELAPAIPYVDALAEMLAADGLLLFQAANCNHQIPAKLYEYLRAKRPIFALTDPAGDTGQALHGLGIDSVAPLNDATRIADHLVSFLARVRAGTAPLADAAVIANHSRRSRTAELAALLDTVI